jgi:hypothetical protein
MNRVSRIWVTWLALLWVLASTRGNALATTPPQTIPSPDHTMSAVIRPVGPKALESRVEIYRSNGKVVYTQDYSSADGEHGLTVTEARWTPDSRFFVYSTESSGGHQPYHAPTYFYSRRTNRVSDMEDLNQMVVNQAPSATFKILPPDSVSLVTSENGLNDQQNTIVNLITGVITRQTK